MKTMRLMILALAMVLSASVSEAKTLIVYYSYTNHVKEMVDDLSNIIVADVVRIEPTDKSGGYELNNYAMGTRLLNAIRNNPDALSSYPTIESLDINWADYDRVVMGHSVVVESDYGSDTDLPLHEPHGAGHQATLLDGVEL